MDSQSPIAIVGYSYRAPGVGRKGLWEFLAEAKSAWSKVPVDRFDQDAFHHPDAEKGGCFSSQGAHFLPDDIYKFDAPFFNLRAEEARAVDPQHRMLLECALEAAENAGIRLVDLAGTNIGVFSAVGASEYAEQAAEDLPNSTRWTATGTAGCMFANRLSYFFNLIGPSITMDAACASSSYAVHTACQSLRAGECKSAIVGAATLLMGPGHWVMLDTMGALSPEGKSFSYDARASGFGRGEGAACLILKPLADAIEAGDPIQAVIRHSAVNHSGRSEGITMPSRTAQESLLRQVHLEAGLDPVDTPVVEGHGTGTQVGDPIEAGAFATVLASKRTSSNPLYIGSLKSNFGHLEGASGILAMIKAILMIQHGCILPNAQFEKFNVNIEGVDKLRVAQTTLPWPQNAAKRVCVTNFGFGGSNAVLLLEEGQNIHQPSHQFKDGGPEHINNPSHLNGESANDTAYIDDINYVEPTSNIQRTRGNGLANRDAIQNGVSSSSMARLFVLSAKSENSLRSYLECFKAYLATAPGSKCFARDLTYTLGQRRTHHSYRIAVAADSVAHLQSQLEDARISKIRDTPVAFVFTGQGAQYAQMATGLRHYLVFSVALDQAEACLQGLGAPWSLNEELDKPEAESRINEAEFSQPACTAVQLALVALLKSWGVRPAVVTGHSSGEIAAGFAAGLISYEAAIAIAYFRGQAVAKLARESHQKGAMLALGVGVEEATALLQQNTSGYATVAAINSLKSVTLSGDESTIESIRNAADRLGIFARRLKVDIAYHSDHMKPIAATYLESIKPVCGQDDLTLDNDGHSISFVSSVTGTGVDTMDASYWVRNLLQPVRFSDAIECVLSTRKDTKSPVLLVEIGPHSALQNPIKQSLKPHQTDQNKSQLAYLPSLIRGTRADEALLNLAGSLFTLGIAINFVDINQTSKHTAHALTSLPPYSWDNSTRYIRNSRLVQERLHPGQPYDELLGWKTSYGVGGDQVFRQVFTLDHIPWIRGHNVGGKVIFPMTGYLSMAIEAMRRVSPAPPSSILLREVHLKHSLEIDEDERVDIVTRLRPAIIGSDAVSSTTWVFEIASWTEQRGWTTHCHGQIEAEEADIMADSPLFASSLPLINDTRLTESSPRLVYDAQAQGGTVYSPEFQTTTRFWEGPGWTVMENKLRDLDLSKHSPFGSIISVDPPTLDGLAQGFGPLQAASVRGHGQMPTFIGQLRINNKIPADDKLRFTIVTRLLDQDTRTGILRINIAAFAQYLDSLMTVAEWECLTLRSIGSFDAGDGTANLPASYYRDLIPSLDFVDSKDLSRVIEIIPVNEEELPRRRMGNRVALTYMSRALDELANDDLSHLPSHLLKFVDWAKHLVSQDGGFLAADESLLAEIANYNAQGEMLCAIGEQLVPILRGQVQPLEIMLRDGLLTRNYDEDNANAHAAKTLAKCARHLANISSDMRILEIGAGTGSATLPVLEELWPNAERSPAFHSYTFTDISAGFFENADAKLAKWSQAITYKKLDISQDPMKQGFVAGDYDLVIASNVLHATADMTLTIDHVRALLRPNGKLLLLEGIRHAPVTMPFALLPGWWYAVDEYRDHKEGPLLSDEAWQRLLTSRGFSGSDICIKDYPDIADHHMSVMCCTRIGTRENWHSSPSITICGPFMDNQEQEFAQMVSDQITSRLGCECLIKPFLEIDTDDDSLCIFIDSPQNSIFSDVSSETFEALQNSLLETKGLLWVVPENHAPACQSAKGVINSLRHEIESKNLLWFESVPRTSQGASAIAKLAERLRDQEAVKDSDQDFVWHHEMIKLLRLRQATAAKEVFGSEAGVPVRKMQNIWDSDKALEMTMDVAGSPSSIYFRRTDALQESMGKDEVLIKTEATGMNFRDLLVVLGSIPWTPPGFEGVGRVIRTGSNVTDLQPGERVYFCSYGGSFATYIRLNSWQACKLPDSINSADAASVPIAYHTAYVALYDIGRLQRGETVLIHAASGAVGQACIVLAQRLGAHIFATAGTPEKRDFIHDTFEIPKTQIFSSRTAQFKNAIMSETGGKGVDVIVNSLSGNLLQESWALIADFGRFVELGKKDFLQNSGLSMRPFDRNATFIGVDLRTYMKRQPKMLKERLVMFTDLLQQGVIVPIRPITLLPVSELATGLRKLQSGKNIGKIVITMGPEDCAMAESSTRLGPPSGHLLQPDSTYVITGGTGGIGLSLAPWMIENGARNVVLLGRSGASRPEVKRVLEQFEGTDIRLRAIACDVGSRVELQQALESIQDLPPVRGVVHGALFLRDALFMNATYEDWQNITRPRVQGAWNLHELLPELDFFVILSSLLGDLGNMGQAIYAGTATFFDAFAMYRIARGQPTVSISLPVVLGVGYVVERNLTEKLQDSLGATLSEVHLRTLIKGAIIGPSSGLNFNGKAASFLPEKGNDTSTLPWQCFNPRHITKLIHTDKRGLESKGRKQGGIRSVDANSGDPFENLLNALMDKVSSITMIERDEVEADAPLARYSLDSLVSVELRDWIRRETAVDLGLPSIVRASNLRALAMNIASQQK
ncbi:Type I Iterative PKS [Arthroderma sp. PD_2]|nr:Type I Iterative PKS [Arthroderma sp. PD_2]